ncbi:hypothetical protein A176_005273 [Myxococcus hansupus]|uniref:Uncharacterized protein n=1 Tax=Pseudomyxococcus hansupus TaxID=1297742 RepID=A0A0H4WY70_9BACT|nr:hypothetical protein A176_005273 [Myxococcus hansupus]
MTKRLWAHADEIGFLTLSPTSKSRHYDNWTGDPSVGGVLTRFLDPGQVRLYIKDAVMKRYARARREDPRMALSPLGIPLNFQVLRTYIKPHGLLLADGKVVCWGRANSWKLVLLAVHERAFEGRGAVAYGAVLTQAAGHFSDKEDRAVVEDAATKLGIQQLRWVLT